MSHLTTPALPRRGAASGEVRGRGRHLLVLCALLGGGCAASSVRDGVVRTPDAKYTVGSVGPSWRQVGLRDNDLTYVAKDSGHSLAVNATCEGHDDPPLEALTQHLLIGFTQREPLEESRVQVDGREALRSHYKASLDGVPVEMLFVVLKKDGCVYDFTYLSPVGRFEQRREDFESLVSGFHAEERR